jgi:negative regulator of flagellin synthesis FlgM
MVIDKIGNINNIIEPKKTKAVSGSKELKQSDSVQISSEAKNAAETAKITQIVQSAPDIRVDRVNEIKEKIANGTYNFDDQKVLDMVADKIATFLLRK